MLEILSFSIVTFSSTSQESGTLVSAAARPSVSEVGSWNVDKVIEHLKRQFSDDVLEEDCGILWTNRVTGCTLLEMTEKKLMQVGMVLGPALVINKHVQELKGM